MDKSTPQETSAHNQHQAAPVETQGSSNIPNFSEHKGMSNGIKILLGVLGCSLALCCILTSIAVAISVTNKESSNTNSNSDNPKPTSTTKPTPTVEEEPEATPTKTKVTPTTSSNDYNEEVFYPEGGTLPISSDFAAKMTGKTRLLTPAQGYAANVNSIGIPTYNFSILYDMKWATETYDEGRYILKGPSNEVETGILYFEKDSAPFNLGSCEKIVKEIFGDQTLEVEKNEKITVNGETWERITYNVTDSKGTKQKGIDQCLIKDDMIMDHFVLALADVWEEKSGEYLTMMNDIYIHKVK